MMDRSVLVVGSIALDDVETPFGERKNSVGGSAIYFSMAASLLTRVRMIGVAGEDFPAEVLELLKTRQIDLQGFQIAKGKTFRWGGIYHADINHRDTLYTQLNVFADFRPEIPSYYRKTPFVFLGNIQPALQSSVLNQIQQPKFIAMDTMNLWINTSRKELIEVIQNIDMLLINNEELFELTDERNLIKGLKALHNYGVNYIVVKKGEHGAFLSQLFDGSYQEPSLFYAPAYPVPQPTDPTGAGDSFAGGFLGYLAGCDEINFANMKKALLYGGIMGSFCIEQFGVDGLKDLTTRDINSRYQRLRELVSV